MNRRILNLLIALATTALGMTTAQLDQLFIVADSLP